MRNLISDVLWVGNARDGRDTASVLKLGIEAVVDLAAEETPIVYPRDIIYCRFPLTDGAGNSTVLLQSAIRTIAGLIRGKIPTLVACSAGVSRAPATVAAAIAANTGSKPEESLAKIAALLPHDISPGLWSDVCRAAEPL